MEEEVTELVLEGGCEARGLGGQPRGDRITFVKDRPGHDRRYAIDASLIQRELGWVPKHTFHEGLRATVRWYIEHEQWLRDCISGDYLKYYDSMYVRR